MRKISPKTVWYALISVCIVMVLGVSACVKPVDVESFLEDDAIKDSLEAAKGLVRIDTRSDSYKTLKAGNSRISGLKKDKYYMIEMEKDENGDPVDVDKYPKYVTDYYGPSGSLGPGGWHQDLGVITRIRDGNINGLTNNHIYKIRETTAFPDDIVFNYENDTGTSTSNGTTFVKNGTIPIPALKGNISLVNFDASYYGYEVMAVTVSSTILENWGGNVTKEISSTTELPLEKAGTTVDYVFVRKTGYDWEFKVLRVKIAPFEGGKDPIDIAAIPGVTAPVAGAEPVTAITPTAQYAGSISWSPALVGGRFAPKTVYTATITLSPKAGYTLTGVEANFFTVAGTSSPATNPFSSGIVTAVFPETGTLPIDIAAIPGVTAPVAGATPVTAITPTPQYTGTITWAPSDSQFVAGREYTATITLVEVPGSGYTLTGVGADFFTVAGATSVQNAANSGVVTAIFPETGEVGIKATITFDITDIVFGDITKGGNAPDPVTYGDLAGTKTLTFTLDGGYSNVTWEMDGDSIGTGNTVTLNAANTTFLSKLVSGTRIIVVSGTKGGQYWSFEIPITVNNN